MTNTPLTDGAKAAAIRDAANAMANDLQDGTVGVPATGPRLTFLDITDMPSIALAMFFDRITKAAEKGGGA